MLQYLLYIVAKFLAVSLPTPIKYWVALRISDLYFIFNKKAKKAVFYNLKNILPDKSIYRTARDVFHHFGKYLADFLFIGMLNRYNWKKWVKTVNLEYFDKAYRKNKGVVALTCHIGNWELGGIVLALIGYPTSAIVLPQRNRLVNRIFMTQRQSKGLQPITVGPHLRECFRRLKNGEVVAILGDRNLGGSGGVEVDFFDRKVSLPRGPAVLAYLTGATILPGFTIRNEDNTYTLYFESPIEVERYKDKDEFIRVNTQKISRVLEKYISLYPEQWCVFEELWQNIKD